MWNQNETQGSTAGNVGLRAVQEVNAEETLASLTPRVLVRAQQVAEQANQIAHSLGLVPSAPPKGVDQKAPAPTLMGALREIENCLEFALGRLDTTHRHING